MAVVARTCWRQNSCWPGLSPPPKLTMRNLPHLQLFLSLLTVSKGPVCPPEAGRSRARVQEGNGRCVYVRVCWVLGGSGDLIVF